MAIILKFAPVLSLAEQKSTLDRAAFVAHRIKVVKARLKRLYAIKAPQCILDNDKNHIRRLKEEYARLYDVIENKHACDRFLEWEAAQIIHALAMVKA